MDYSKSWYSSTTIQGAVISALVFIIQVSGLKIESDLITQLVIGVFGLIGVIMTIYGRIKARSVLK